jgi:hypothetical protein
MRFRDSRFHLVLIAAVSTTISSASAENPYAVSWIKQFGTTGNDGASAVSIDNLGNIFVAGFIQNDIQTPTSTGSDGFIRNYDSTGALVWNKQFGDGFTLAYDIAADGLGNAYVTGLTAALSSGASDGFLNKYDSHGNLLWGHQLNLGSLGEWGDSVFADALGNVYVSGAINYSNAHPTDGFLTKYDAQGNQLWARQFGTKLADEGFGVAGDRFGNVYVTGATYGALGDQSFGSDDAFVSKYDGTGNLVWTKQWGTSSYEVSYTVATDNSGNVYIAGLDGHAFVNKYDPSGNLQWTQTIASDDSDYAAKIKIDAQGSIYVVGYTRGTLGAMSYGDVDAFVSKLSPAGRILWTTQLGTDALDGGSGIAVDDNANVYIAGLTDGSLGAPYSGLYNDAFVAKLTPNSVPEPGSLILAIMGSCAVWSRRLWIGA